MAFPAFVFEGSSNVVRENATGVTVSVGSTPEFEDVLIGIEDPRFGDGKEVTFPGRLLFRLKDGTVTPDPNEDSHAPPCGYRVSLLKSLLQPYLAETGRGVDELKTLLCAGLQRVWSNKARVAESDVVITFSGF